MVLPPVNAVICALVFRYHDGDAYIIDVSQSVEHDHPHALEFLRKDCSNVNGECDENIAWLYSVQTWCNKQRYLYFILFYFLDFERNKLELNHSDLVLNKKLSFIQKKSLALKKPQPPSWGLRYRSHALVSKID